MKPGWMFFMNCVKQKYGVYLEEGGLIILFSVNSHSVIGYFGNIGKSDLKLTCEIDYLYKRL